VVKAEIRDRNAPVDALQGRWTKLRSKLDESINDRPADPSMADVPGGGPYRFAGP
jgi:hypothetical protein